MDQNNRENYTLNGRKYKVIGRPPVKPEGLDVLALQKQSYARFLRRLPRIIGDRFPVEVSRNGKTYRMDIRNVRVRADLSKDGWKDEKSYTATIRECTHARKTLSYDLDADIRFYVDGVSVAAFPARHLFQFPAMTPRASFIFGGIEKALKIERSEDGETFMGPGEILESIISNADITSQLESSLPRIVDNAVGKGVLDLRLDAVSRDIAKIPKRPGTITVNERNPLAVLASLNVVSFPFMEDGGETALSNQGEYNLADLLFVSSVAKKEGPKLLLNGHVTMFATIDEDGKLRVPVHTVSNGVVTDEIVMISQDDLLKGRTVSAYIPEGERITPDTKVISYRKGKKLDGSGNPVSDTVERDVGEASEIGAPDYVAVSPWSMMSVNEYVNCFALNCNPTRNAMAIAHANQAQWVEGLGPKRVRSLDDSLVADAVQAYLTSPDDGTVESVGEDSIVIRKKDGVSVSVGLDDYVSDSTGTDQRYSPVAQAGDTVGKGQLIADGPFTRNAELHYGVPDGLCAVIPFSSAGTLIGGEYVAGAGGTSNNDAIVISESFARKFRRSGVVTVSLDLQKTAKGYGILKAPVDPDGNPDPRFDPETGLPLPGSVFTVGDTVLNQMIPDVTADVPKTALASGEAGRFASPEKLKRDVVGTVREIRVNGSRVEVVMDYTRVLEPGDKLTLGYGQKAVVAAIVPDALMPAVDVNGKMETVDMCIDPILVKRAPVALMAEGHIAMAMKETDSYGIAEINQNNAVFLSMEENMKAGLPHDGMFVAYMPDGKGGRNRSGMMVECFCPYVCLNDKEGMDQRRKDIAAGVKADRELNKALLSGIPGGEDALIKDLAGDNLAEANERVKRTLVQAGVRVTGISHGTRDR